MDGTDLAACLKVVGDAVARARAGHGPQLVVAHLLRLCGHGEHDDASYIDPKLKSSAARSRLPEGGRGYFCCNKAGPTPQRWRSWRSEAVQQVEDAVATVQREPAPDPFAENWSALATAHLAEGNA